MDASSDHVDDADHFTTDLFSDESMQKAAAMWVLKTRKLHRIPQSVMDEMVTDIQGLFQASLSKISERIKFTLTEASVEDKICESVLRHLNEEQPLCNIFRGLQSHHQQLSYLKKNCDLVVSRFSYHVTFTMSFLGASWN